MIAWRFTLKDIATRLEISTSTVSRVINDKPGINEKTRQRVLEAIKEYKDASNSAAKDLATSKTRNVAMIGKKREPRLESGDYFQRSIISFDEELRNRGYHIIFMSINEEEMMNANELNILKEKRSDGFIIRGPGMKPKFILDIKSTGLPIILFGNELIESDIDCIVCQDRKGSYQITNHLIEHGHKEIIFLSGPQDWSTNRKRREGYKEALKMVGIEPKILYMSDTTTDSGRKCVQHVLEIQPRITAVVAVNDSTAVGVINEARNLGLKVPEDLAVVGFDDIAWASLSHPPLTTVHVCLEEMGRLAAFRLLELIKNTNLPPIKITVATKLVIRNSCGC